MTRKYERQTEEHPPDFGCREASAFLQRQSRCQACPFDGCLHALAFAERMEALSLATEKRDGQGVRGKIGGTR